MAFLPPIHDPSTPILPPIHQAHNTRHKTNVPVSKTIQIATPSSSHKAGISSVRSEDYDKWNDMAFTLSLAEGPEGIKLFTLKSFFSKIYLNAHLKY